MMPIKVLWIDDQPGDSAHLSAVLRQESGIALIDDAVSGTAAEEAVHAIKADVVVMYVACPSSRSLEAIQAFLKRSPGVRIIVLTEQATPESLFMLLHAGAHGLLLAQTARGKILPAVRAVYGGGTFVHNDAAAAMIADYLNRRVGSGSLRSPS